MGIGVMSRRMNYSRPQFRKDHHGAVNFDTDGKLIRDVMVRCKSCNKLGPRPKGDLTKKTLRCTRCGQKQTIIEMIKAAESE
jgi:hypothetical protein